MVAHVKGRDTNKDHEALERRADELAALAALRHSPGERAWYLQMANAFRKLAALGERDREGGGRP